jgi:hypothetical protein
MAEELQFPEITVKSVALQFGELATRLKAPPGSLVSLVFADDWSSVIRSHALVEGAVTVMLSDVIDERLRDTFAKLELGKEDTGKLAFAKALNLLTDADRRFVRMLSSLRNRLAHDMQHLTFTFADHVGKMDKQQRDAWVTSLHAPVHQKWTTDWRKVCLEMPKIAVLYNVHSLCSLALTEAQMGAITREESANALQEMMQGRWRDDESDP